ncbi:MAG: hypothetical protein Q7T26_13140 [Dehalococcoidia bacterium]|nr:hypothetical protein [Dehalococcoidia bacterium]
MKETSARRAGEGVAPLTHKRRLSWTLLDGNEESMIHERICMLSRKT